MVGQGRGKHKKEWVGYKVQVAETVPKEEGQIGFITSMVTQRASESDDPGLDVTLEKQAQMGLERPSEMYVDGAYISAGSIQQAKEQDWNLMGPAQPSAARTGLDKAYRIEAFDVSISERKAICPAGKTSTQCSQLTEQKSGKVTYRFEFGRQCRDCPAKSLCVPKDQPHRTIVVGALHEVLQQTSSSSADSSRAPKTPVLQRNQRLRCDPKRWHQKQCVEKNLVALMRAGMPVS
jgi:transposase